jgi:hypothetical protein
VDAYLKISYAVVQLGFWVTICVHWIVSVGLEYATFLLFNFCIHWLVFCKWKFGVLGDYFCCVTFILVRVLYLLAWIL